MSAGKRVNNNLGFCSSIGPFRDGKVKKQMGATPVGTTQRNCVRCLSA